MFDKLKVFENKYEEISARLCDPAVASSAEKYTEAMKELKSVEPIALKFREYKTCKKELSDAEEMFSEESDSELKEMIGEELAELKNREGKLTEELKILLLPKDPNDDRNVIVEIRGGAGGEEAEGGEKHGVVAQRQPGETPRRAAERSADPAVHGAVQVVFFYFKLARTRSDVSKHLLPTLSESYHSV